MIYWQNRILTNVKNTVSEKCTNVVSTESNIKAKFPAMLVKISSNAELAGDLDGDGEEENAVRCIVTIESYCKTKLQDNIKLMELANGAMYQMGFKRRQGPLEIDNIDAPEVFRMTARYVRIIGADDTINLISSNGGS